MGDTDLTRDAGKSSASRQTFVSGNAPRFAGEDLRSEILRLSNAGVEARIAIEEGIIQVSDGDTVHTIDLSRLPVQENGDVPDIECIIIEDEEPMGPYGAKGIGEPALIPTAPALLGAIHHTQQGPDCGGYQRRRIGSFVLFKRFTKAKICCHMGCERSFILFLEFNSIIIDKFRKNN